MAIPKRAKLIEKFDPAVDALVVLVLNNVSLYREYYDVKRWIIKKSKNLKLNLDSFYEDAISAMYRRTHNWVRYYQKETADYKHPYIYDIDRKYTVAKQLVDFIYDELEME